MERLRAFLFVSLSAAAMAACGGITSVDSIGEPSGSGTGQSPNGSSGPSANGNENGSGTSSSAKDSPIPKQPVGPYTGSVGTTDVSILYPLPASGKDASFVRPTDVGNHGVLLPRAWVDAITTSLEKVTTEHPSGYGELALISLRLDPCSARGVVAGAGAGACRSEVRGVFQAIYDEPGVAPAATDGAFHVMWNVDEGELVTMQKEILTLKKANGDLALQELAPHPILVQQGLSGAFATGLRNIILSHLGADRVGRITAFDHNFSPDSDGWLFESFDVTRPAGNLVRAAIHGLPADHTGQMVAGSAADVSPFSASSASTFSGPSSVDAVEPIVDANRAPPGAGGAGMTAMRNAYAAALRIQNPTKHTAESTDCANCHLAEGATQIGQSLYGFGFDAANSFVHPRSLAKTDERSSVTNLHAFGYLHRRVSIMQRTANESVIVASKMEALVAK